MNTPTILTKIVDRKREEIEARSKATTLADLKAMSADVGPARGFVKAIQTKLDQGQSAVIAEIKKASPLYALTLKAVRVRPFNVHVAV